jgi:hypothetical protein
VNTDATLNANQTPGNAATIDIVALDPNGVEQRVFDTKISLYDANLSSNGRVGIFKHRDLKSSSINTSDTSLSIPALLAEKLEQDPRDLYHRLWVAPDGIHYAVAISHSLHIYQTGQATPLQTYEFPAPGVVHQLAWSPDSTAIYYRRWEPRPPFEFYGAYAHRISAATPQSLALGLIGGATWSPDSRWLVAEIAPQPQCAGTEKGCVKQQKVINPFTGQSQIIFDGFPTMYDQAVWSSDATQIATICYHQLTQKSPEIIELCVMNIKDQE